MLSLHLSIVIFSLFFAGHVFLVSFLHTVVMAIHFRSIEITSNFGLCGVDDDDMMRAVIPFSETPTGKTDKQGEP